MARGFGLAPYRTLIALSLILTVPNSALALPLGASASAQLAGMAAALRPQLMASVYLQVLAGGMESQASSGDEWVENLKASVLEQQHTCKGFPSTAACVALVAGVQAAKSAALKGGASAAQAAVMQLNKAMLLQLGTKNKLVAPPRGSATNQLCQLVEQLARTTLGDATGSLAGDVIGSSALDKLNELATGAITPGSRLWPLPAGTTILQLVQPCEPLSKVSHAAANTAPVVALPVLPASGARRLLVAPK